MIAMKQDCLAVDDIRRVIEGGLPADEFESAVAHLDDCIKCRSAAESLQDSSAVVASDPGDIDAIQNETACQAAVQALLQTPSPEATPAVQIMPRSKLGPYVLSGSLGSGGMSTVMLGQHERLKRDCAIKLLPRERVHTPGWLDRFEREMVAVAALEHPNIVRATDAGHEDGWHYLVMEHLDGLDVGRIARRLGSLAIADACKIVSQAAQGLSAIHDSGLVHRDIKPSNLMLTRAGIVKVLDLGLVLGGDDPICVDDRLTTVGHLMGTVAFMSPEQLADSSNVDTRADLYSLGATLYRLLAGRAPHQRQGGLAKQILAITSQDAPPIQTIRPEVPADVADLITKLLSRDPESRPASADDVAQRLAAAARGSRLKKLVATALRTPEDPDASRVTAMPAAATPPPKSPWAKRIGMAMGGAAILIAALIFKVKTDVGDLIVHSEQDGLTLVVTRDAKVVDRLTIETMKQNRFTLSKGTYRIAIEGGGTAVKLSDEVVTIGRGASVPVNVQSSAMTSTAEVPRGPLNLFQGHDYTHWISVLTHERDLSQVMQAILAVQALADTPQQQSEAAGETLRLARRWGGHVLTQMKSPSQISPDTDPSRIYMAYLGHIFERYTPDAMFAAIDQELIDGNEKSVQATNWLYGSAALRYSTQFDGPLIEGWLQADDSSGSRAKLMSSIAASLIDRAPPIVETPLIADAQLVPDPKLAQANFNWDQLRENAIQIQLLLGNSVADEIELSAYVASKFRATAQHMDERTVRAGVQMAKAGCDSPTWAQLAESVLDLKYEWTEAYGPGIVESIAQAAPTILAATIEGKLDDYAKSALVDHPRYITQMRGRGGMAGRYSSEPARIAFAAIDTSQTAWDSAFEFYSEFADPNQATIDRLAGLHESVQESVRQAKQGGGLEVGESVATVRHTLSRLTERFTVAHGKPPKTASSPAGLVNAELAEPAPQQAAGQPPTVMYSSILSSGADQSSADVSSTIPSSNTKPHLYRGKPIAHYFAVMNNDADVTTVADAIAAVELLSRGTELRELSATKTLALSRRWGSLVQTGSNDTTTAQGQSGVFMGTLLSTFPAYFPEPAFRAIAAEVDSANSRSLATCAYLLNHYRVGWFQQSSSNTRCREALATLIRLAEEPVAAETLAKIEAELVDAVAELDTSVLTYSSEAEMRLKTALWIHLALNDDVASDSWAHAYVQDELKLRMQNWSPDINDESHQFQSFTGGTSNVWGIDEDQILAALRTGGLDANTKRYVCDVWTDKWFRVRTPRSREIFEHLKTDAKESLLASFETELMRLAYPVAGYWMYGNISNASYSILDGDQAVLLTDTQSALAMTLQLYAAQGRPTRYHIGVLRACLARLQANGIEHCPSLTLAPIEAAIAELSQRYEKIHGEKPPLDDGPIADPGDLPSDASTPFKDAAATLTDDVSFGGGPPAGAPTVAVTKDAEKPPAAAIPGRTPTKDAAEAPAQLYQGKTLAEWITVMQFEQDMNTVGEAMRAAELLTRGSDQRLHAATETLEMARKWGGIIIGSTRGERSYRQPQSQLFMGYFTEVFRHYLPDPGLELLAAESAGGNTKSRLASILCLENYTTGIGPNEMAVPDEDTLQSWNAVNQEKSEAVFQLLTKAVDENARTIKDAGENTSENTKLLTYLEPVLLRYALHSGFDIEQNKVIKARVRDEIDRAKRDQAEGTATGMGATSAWGTPHLRDVYLYAAILLSDAKQIDADWPFFADELMMMRFVYSPQLLDDAIELIQKNAKSELIESAVSALVVVRDSYRTDAQDGSNAHQDPYSNWLVTGAPWEKLLPIIAEASEDPERIKKLLQEIKTQAYGDQLPKNAMQQSGTAKAIDAAIAKLESRLVSADNSERQN